VFSVAEAPYPRATSAPKAILSIDELPSDERSLHAESDAESIVLRYYEDVFRYAYRLAGNGEDAADLAQQTYLLAGRRIHQLREIARCRSWLLAIVRTCFLKSIQRRRLTLATDIDLEVQQIARKEQESSIDREEIGNGLDQLAETDRTILLMFYFEEQSYKEIASQLDIPIGTVMSRLSRAKQRLRQWLDRRNVEQQIESKNR
jgi:RNA polymerase sigma-70 factor, ECF subfamily